MRQAADGPLGPQAQWLLGAYFLQVGRAAERAGRSRAMAALAADAGIPPAIDRLADMHLQGIGLPFSIQEALDSIAGWRSRDRRRRHGKRDISPANATLRGSRNDPSAPPSSVPARSPILLPITRSACASRWATGMTRDLAFARALLLRAADGGFLDAREAAEALAPEREAGGEAAAWHQAETESRCRAANAREPGARRCTTRAVPRHVLAQLEAHLVSIGHPALQLDQAGRACVRPMAAIRCVRADRRGHGLPRGRRSPRAANSRLARNART